jgi:hypothetical protein
MNAPAPDVKPPRRIGHKKILKIHPPLVWHKEAGRWDNPRKKVSKYSFVQVSVSEIRLKRYSMMYSAFSNALN